MVTRSAEPADLSSDQDWILVFDVAGGRRRWFVRLEGARSGGGELVRPADVQADELRPRRNAELGEHVVEVVAHRTGAQEQLGGDDTVGAALCGQAGDLQLLRRELLQSDRRGAR